MTWWYRASIPSGRGASVLLVYLGMALLSLAWLGLGRLLATRRAGRAGGLTAPSRRDLLIIGAAWSLPLALGPALFSRDVYSYLAQGTLLNAGLNPYHDTPAVLGQLGHAHVLDAVSSFWRHTPAPYGPLFLGLIDLIVVLVGSHLVAGVLLVRVLELTGLALLAVFVPRLTRALGTDEVRATWLILSPLAMLELVAAGHNDALMIGLLVAGVAVALEGRPLRGVALCALAATIKVPALAGAVFIAVAWARAEATPRAQLQFLLSAALVAVGALGLISLGTGLGVSWLTSTVFSAPAKVHLAITPGTGVGWTVAALARDAGIKIGTHAAESAFAALAAAITAIVGLRLLYRVRIPTLVPYLGGFLIAAAAGGPAAWPWYFSWGMALLAACRGPQRSIAVALALALAAFLVKPNGILALPIGSAPAVVIVYALIGAAVWWVRRNRPTSRGDRGVTGHNGPSIGDGALSGLIRT